MNNENNIIYNGDYKITYPEDSKKGKKIEYVCNNFSLKDITTGYTNDHPYTTYLNKDNGVINIKIMFRDGEFVEYNNAYDLQDFLNQVNHYHDLRKDFQTVVDKLLESKPELEDWVKKNFGRYIIKDN